MPIVVMKPGQGAKKVTQMPISQEEYLQKYIHDNPDIIPLDDIKEDLRLLVLAREFPASSGSIDALAVDDEGAVYIVETKLYKNPDKRLVVAQLLDYGAALWNSYRDYSEAERILDRAVNQKFPSDYEEKYIGFQPDQWINRTTEMVDGFDELIRQTSNKRIDSDKQ